jgi:branched-chain amino acid transport system permease protein
VERYVAAPGWQRALVGALVLNLLLVLGITVASQFVGSAVIISMLIAVVIVVALGSFVGNSGVLSLGHVGFVALGAYVSGLLTIPPEVKATALPKLPTWLQQIELPLPLATLAAVVVVAVAALLFSPVVTRPSGYAAAIATLGVLVIIRSALIWMDPLTRGSQTFYGVPRLTTVPVALAVACGTVVLARLFRESASGVLLRATRDDELAARAFGANVARLRLQAWLLSAMLAGVGGSLMGHFITAFSPAQFFLPLTLSYLVMLIVGGSATVAGAVLGAAGIVLATEFLGRLETGFTIGPLDFPTFFGLPQLVLAVLMILVLYVRPQGLIGVREPDETIVATVGARSLRRKTKKSDGPRQSLDESDQARKAVTH